MTVVVQKGNVGNVAAVATILMAGSLEGGEKRRREMGSGGGEGGVTEEREKT